MSDHAKFSPSQLKRIIACPGSIQMCEAYENTTSSYAEEGTMLHAVMEDRLRLAKPWPKSLTKEQLRACETCEDYFKDLLRELAVLGPVRIDLERQVSLENIGVDDCYGTADVVIVVNNTCHIIDWKFGQGVSVSPVNNPQLKAYGLGAALDGDYPTITNVVTHIVQPRLNNMSSVTYQIDELTRWCWYELEPALELASDRQMPLDERCNPGVDQCQWCLAKGNCKYRFLLARKTAEQVFKVYADSPHEVSPEEISALLAQAPMLEKYLKDIKNRALTTALNGGSFPGFKAVLGRSSRQWKDEVAAQEFMLSLVDEGKGVEFDELFVSKFVSVAQAEKLAKHLKKDDRFQDLYHKVEGKPTLVPESDPREPYSMSAATVFAAHATR